MYAQYLKYFITAVLVLIFFGCTKAEERNSYIKGLERDNNISFTHVNNYGIYIPSMCYTKTKDKSRVYNPCYSCHTKGSAPNYFNDTILQKEYNFPKEMMKNPYNNLFKDRKKELALISDREIMEYVDRSNYFSKDGTIILSESLPVEWSGYRPDCYFNFDEDGFDRDKQGRYTLWRAFRYYPFLGSFWPTNGSMDDVMIRVDKKFSLDSKKEFNLEVYALNLAIIEANVKQKSLPTASVDESIYGVDIDGDGKIAIAHKVTNNISYVGYAKQLLENAEIYLVSGLFPLNTEFLHSVRYLGVNKNNKIVIPKRMKELRYSKKLYWRNYSQLKQLADKERWEAETVQNDESQLKVYRGDFEHGFDNEIGWRYQGFIEDKTGALRPQTNEETISCMGCHSALGATTDSTFSFIRKFEGVDKNRNNLGWSHWGQKGLSGIKDRVVSYKIGSNKAQTTGEYAFYLKNSMGSEFRDNSEIIRKFFDIDGVAKTSEIDRVAKDISILLVPSKERAINLNRAYKLIVEEQSFGMGKDANIKPMDKVYKEIKVKSTHILSTINPI